MKADVVIAGQGIIGLCAALALSDRSLSVVVVGQPATGEASRAAAGMLAPSVERASDAVDMFGIAARERYPSYLDYLRECTGISVPLNRNGILQVALSPAGVKGLRKSAPASSTWLDRDELVKLEPALTHALGAVHNPLDGAVDNVVLMDALRSAARKSRFITLHAGRVLRVEGSDGSVTVQLVDGITLEASHFILAAGAWSGQIEGVSVAKSVFPLKGQLIEFAGPSLSHVTYGPRGYVVPRGNSVIGGSTAENTEFDASISAAGVSRIRSAAAEILPSLADLEPTSAWAGLRPVTPDGLPLIGRDRERPPIIYACGHGRNGILMAPLTGDLVADLVTASPLPHDLSQFRPDRF